MPPCRVFFYRRPCRNGKSGLVWWMFQQQRKKWSSFQNRGSRCFLALFLSKKSFLRHVLRHRKGLEKFLLWLARPARKLLRHTPKATKDVVDVLPSHFHWLVGDNQAKLCNTSIVPTNETEKKPFYWCHVLESRLKYYNNDSIYSLLDNQDSLGCIMSLPDHNCKKSSRLDHQFLFHCREFLSLSIG